MRDHIRAGARTIEALARVCGAGTDCEACHWQLREMIADEGAQAATSIESDGAP